MSQPIQSVTRFVLDYSEKAPNAISSKQYDVNSRIPEITLVDNGVPINLTGAAVRINALMFDGTRAFNNCQIVNAAQGIVRVTLTNQMLAGRGPLGTGGRDEVILADISIHSAGETTILTSPLFVINAQATVRDEAAIESSDEFGAVLDLFRDVWDMREVIRSIDERFGQPADGVRPGNITHPSMFALLNWIQWYLQEYSAAGIAEDVDELLRRVGRFYPITEAHTGAQLHALGMRVGDFAIVTAVNVATVLVAGTNHPPGTIIERTATGTANASFTARGNIGAGRIPRVQRGRVNITAVLGVDVTISSVNMQRAEVNIIRHSRGGTGNTANMHAFLQSSTVLRIENISTFTDTWATVSWEVKTYD